MFWHPESVMEVGLAEFDASALYRTTKQSPACTMPLGSGVTPMVPVLESHDVTVALKYGVALSGRPMIEMMRPTGVNEGLLEGGLPFRFPSTWTLQPVAPQQA